jgi:hypothetical protein
MIAFLAIIFVAGLILYGVVVSGSGQRRKSGRPVASSRGYRGFVDQTETRARWHTIMASSETGASSLKNAINEADKLLDYVMKQLGYPGEKMADRLKLAGPRFTSRDNIWRAHKLRNALAHEIGFDLVPSQAKEALKDFELGLKDLGAL